MPDEASVIINMESMIKSLISSNDKLREEMDLNKGMLDSILDNDPTYKEHSDLAKEAAKVKSNTKREILKQPQAGELANKVQSLRSQIKENKAAMSDYLKEYQRMSGVNEIAGEDGEIREIVFTAKLISKVFR
ncbi:MAG: hypothetical protein Q7R43_02065 [Candidatus Daviesbacteria bacterium]|nr:hypothetical protein [Candidatus Daviesbacteria bacterium]